MSNLVGLCGAERDLQERWLS